MMCGCAICNTSKYMQESFNVWRQKQLKTLKDKAENLRGRNKRELIQAYKSYADYEFPEKQTCHPRYENASEYVLCTPTNDECKYPNWKWVLRKCTVCRAISLSGVEMDTSIRAPTIMFNTFMTQFTCSHHGNLIFEKSPLMWMKKVNLKGFVSYVNN